MDPVASLFANLETRFRFWLRRSVNAAELRLPAIADDRDSRVATVCGENLGQAEIRCVRISAAGRRVKADFTDDASLVMVGHEQADQQ